MYKLIFLFLIVLCCTRFRAQAQQDTTRACFITLKDGSQIKGRVQTINEKELKIKSDNLGEITIARDKIETIEFKSAKASVESPNLAYNNRTRYFFGPSAFMLKKGEGYYQNTYILLQSVNYGFTDHFTMGVGTEILTLLKGEPIVMLTPKYGEKVSDNVNLAVGMITITPFGLTNNLNTIGIVYGAATLGKEDKNITIGTGWGLAFGSNINAQFSKPIVTVSGTYRVSKRVALLTENWLITNELEYSIFVYGLRVMSDNISFDFGLMNNKSIAQSLNFGFPYIDVAVHF